MRHALADLEGGGVGLRGLQKLKESDKAKQRTKEMKRERRN